MQRLLWICLVIFALEILLLNSTIASEKMVLTPNVVADLILKQGSKTLEANISADLTRYEVSKIWAQYDLTFALETGYQKSKYVGGTSGGLSTSSELDESYITTSSLKKAFTTGTQAEVALTRTDIQSDLVSPPLTGAKPQSTRMSLGLTLTQNLWKNFFGSSDRNAVVAAEKTYQSAQTSRLGTLQDLVLSALKSYWKAYVAQENLKDSLEARERYEKLVGSVKKKSGYGYANPGELPQAQAEYEIRVQAVKAASADFLSATEDLVTLLGLPRDTDFIFPEVKDFPAPPLMSDIDQKQLRAIKSAKLNFEAAEAYKKSVESKNRADLSLVAKVFTSGYDEKKSDAETQFFSGTQPLTYIGVKYQYSFGSGSADEEILNAKLKADLQKIISERTVSEVQDKLQQSNRNVINKYNLAVSAKNQLSLREKAVSELQKTYTQGRTDIGLLIDAMNKQTTTRAQYITALGDYQVELNQLAALRDELIPEQDTREK